MARKRSGDIPADLARGQQRFQAWRRTRQARTRIPEPLWALAVRLAEAHGVCRTASTLGLDYYSLKKRVEGATAPPPSTPAPAFFEFPASPLAAPPECMIELEDGAGARLRVVLKGGERPDLESLARTFWDKERCCKSLRR